MACRSSPRRTRLRGGVRSVDSSTTAPEDAEPAMNAVRGLPANYRVVPFSEGAVSRRQAISSSSRSAGFVHAGPCRSGRHHHDGIPGRPPDPSTSTPPTSSATPNAGSGGDVAKRIARSFREGRIREATQDAYSYEIGWVVVAEKWRVATLRESWSPPRLLPRKGRATARSCI